MAEKKKVEIRGIDTPEHLLAFFKAKGHVNMVLRIVDVLELIQDDFLFIKSVVSRVIGADQFGTPKIFFLRLFPKGWIVLPWEKVLEGMKVPDMEKLQSALHAYKEIRWGKGEPNRVDPCPKCNGTGFKGTGDGKCENCDGSGKITTFLEMSDEEAAMAEGRQG